MFEYFHNVCKDCGQVFEKISGEYREECTECQGKTEKLNVIASWGLCNTASLNVFKIEEGIDSKVLVAINDQRPEWCVVEELENDEGDDMKSGIDFHGTSYFFDECMRVGG